MRCFAESHVFIFEFFQTEVQKFRELKIQPNIGRENLRPMTDAQWHAHNKDAEYDAVCAPFTLFHSTLSESR